MNPETMIGGISYTKENSPLAHSLSGSVSIIKLFRPIKFPNIGQLHLSNLYKPLVNILLEIISFLILIPLLLIVGIVLVVTGKPEAFALLSRKKK